MANITIPNLPITASTKNDDILVITDAAGTTTSQVKKSDVLKLINTDTSSSTTDELQSIIASKTSNIENDKKTSSIIASENCDLRADTVFARNNLIVSSLSSDMNSDVGYNNTMISCSNSDMYGGFASAMIGASQSKMYGDAAVMVQVGTNNVDTYGKNNGEYLGAYTTSNSSISLNEGSSILLGANNSSVNSNKSTSGAGSANDVNYFNTSIISSAGCNIVGDTSTTRRNVGIYNSDNVEVNKYENVVVLASTGYTASTDNVVVVPQLVMTEYSSLNFADDTAAAAGGVVLGGVYHNAGALRVRIS